MSERKVMVELTVYDGVSNEELHEAMCLTMHEGDKFPDVVQDIGPVVDVEPQPADTGDAVASLAGKYASFSFEDLLELSTSDETGCLERFANDIRSMAASLLRQNER